MIIVSTRKFAALNTLGSVLLLLSFAFLWGPSAYMQHLVSKQRRLVTVCYMSSLFATLYSSLWIWHCNENLYEFDFQCLYKRFY
ncbi:hypothetical protein KIN20_034592 [Parelaphostrongylus tenuis]|uniref:Vesicle transport protein n=1 Tax=Parelaphostrongylus tenuis TaxID=148309 RepID=A0AAD5RAK2_PARTN|nr:hypothetical protein KIN20_034592 [Parelaphostrongylus tenuis]